MRRRSLVSSAGFTILESLVVMVLIVLLASIVIPGVMGRKAEKVPLPQMTVEKTEIPTPVLEEDGVDVGEAPPTAAE